ncbi:hypothetical protein NG895_06665 [Aeoliella sp. ICT_H6.2]|uniref:Secreted protein n=1 Tax=Aeoliella straminimaris TaxID=2954799 RepID=A0A9X2F816_9BACT|nr:hypothetical protein [Aeoliella straminimaris]MCO6043584.1 hypothetical protein [Aeoliella straminimaris]
MPNTAHHFTNWRLNLLLVAATAGGCLMATATQAAPAPKEVVIVEIRFALTLNDTDVMKSSPQFYTCVPLGNDKCFVITWNYFDQPSFCPGGVQCQVWDNGTLLSVQEIPASELYVNGDVIRWTQKIWVSQGDCYMSLNGLSSSTWGSSLSTAETLVCPNTGMINLNSFSVAEVVKESGIQHGHNRVVSFTVTDVQSKDSEDDKKPIVDSATHMIYQSPL